MRLAFKSIVFATALYTCHLFGFGVAHADSARCEAWRDQLNEFSVMIDEGEAGMESIGETLAELHATRAKHPEVDQCDVDDELQSGEVE
jgi:hypothetical protein